MNGVKSEKNKLRFSCLLERAPSRFCQGIFVIDSRAECFFSHILQNSVTGVKD